MDPTPTPPFPTFPPPATAESYDAYDIESMLNHLHSLELQIAQQRHLRLLNDAENTQLEQNLSLAEEQLAFRLGARSPSRKTNGDRTDVLQRHVESFREKVFVQNEVKSEAEARNEEMEARIAGIELEVEGERERARRLAKGNESLKEGLTRLQHELALKRAVLINKRADNEGLREEIDRLRRTLKRKMEQVKREREKLVKEEEEKVELPVRRVPISYLVKAVGRFAVSAAVALGTFLGGMPWECWNYEN